MPCWLLTKAVFSDLHRKVDAVRPEEFSVSYRRLVQQDFGAEDIENHFSIRKGGANAVTHHDDLLTNIDMILNAMVDDKDNVLPVNFPAVSSILLEFVIALSDYMGWSSMITGALQKKEVRF